MNLIVNFKMSDNTEKLQNLSIDEQKPEGTTAPEAATEPVILGYVPPN